MRKVRIESRLIGDSESTFIIAEAGSNHNGKYSQAEKLIEAAADAGADAIKFQTFRAERLYVKKAGYAEYLRERKPIFKIIKETEMPYEWIPRLFEHCKRMEIMFLSTPFDEISADKLEEVGIPAYKISSYAITHIPLLKWVGKKGKPIILSTGASTLADIEEAVSTIHSQKNRDIMLLQCTAKYPAPLEHINLRVIDTLKQAFQIPVGISDHTRNAFIVPFASVAHGANIIEKHFTLDNSLPGPDHKYAIEPNDLKAMVHGIRGVEKALGSSTKEVTEVERELYKFAKTRIHATRDIPKGSVLSPKNVAVLRSGKARKGLDPKFWDIIMGKRTTKNIKKDEGINWESLLSK